MPVVTVTNINTYKWDTASSEDVDWFLCWTYDDLDVEIIPKLLHKIRPKLKGSNVTLSVYAVTPDSTIDIDDLTTGANPLFTYNLDDSTAIKQYAVKKVRCKNMLMFTVRISGTGNYDGTGLRDTFQEIALDLGITGQER